MGPLVEVVRSGCESHPSFEYYRMLNKNTILFQGKKGVFRVDLINTTKYTGVVTGDTRAIDIALMLSWIQ